MSRIGKLPVLIPAGVTVDVKDKKVSAKGPLGTLELNLPAQIEAKVEDGHIHVTCLDESRETHALHGMARALVHNMVVGVHEGFKRSLEINGVGYKVEQKKEYLVFSLGYSHQIYYELPAGVKATLEGQNRINLIGADRQVVGEAAAKIRSFKQPEPYKGKGIKYLEEVLRRKEGKSGAR